MHIFLKKNRGFTLIEMLLVITVIAIIASMGIMLLHKNAEDAGINKAAMEVQNILQAAISYNVNNNGSWPIAYLCGSSGVPSSNFVNYLPNSDYQSHYGMNYCWSQDSTTPRFWVALPFPGSEYLKAQRIAAALPNAYAVTDVNTATPQADLCTGAESTCYLRAEITQPSLQGGGTASGGLAAAGYCKPPEANNNSMNPLIGSGPNVSCTYQNTVDTSKTTYNIQFPCPSGLTGSVVVTPNFLYMGTQNDAAHTFSVFLYSMKPGDIQVCNTANNITSCSVDIYVRSTIGSGTSILQNTGRPGYVGATYVAYCSVSGS